MEQNSKITSFKVLTLVALLLSIVATGLSVYNYMSVKETVAQSQPVVISKQYDKGRSLAKALETKKPVVVFFYTDWCGFCQKFAPVFDKITRKSDIKKNFAVAFVNCEKEENQALMHEYEVGGYPTVFVIDKNGKRTQLENSTFFQDDSVDVVKKNMMDLIKE